jgi:hypothetical protein
MNQQFYRRPSSSSFDDSSSDDHSHHATNFNYRQSLHGNTSDSEDYEEEYHRNDGLPVIIPQNSRDSFPDERQHGVTESNDSSNLRPSKRANTAGSSTSHATKGGLKLIGDLYDSKNVEFMNSILREAAREGLMKTLGFPKRSEWIRLKVPIWFSSGGILGG